MASVSRSRAWKQTPRVSAPDQVSTIEGEGGDETDDFYADLVEEVAEGEEEAEEWQGHAEVVGVRERVPWVFGVVCVAVVFDRVDLGKRLEACNDLLVAGLHVVWRWGRAELHVSNQRPPKFVGLACLAHLSLPSRPSSRTPLAK